MPGAPGGESLSSGGQPSSSMQSSGRMTPRSRGSLATPQAQLKFI